MSMRDPGPWCLIIPGKPAIRVRNKYITRANRKGATSHPRNPLVLLVPKRELEPRQAYAHWTLNLAQQFFAVFPHSR